MSMQMCETCRRLNELTVYSRGQRAPAACSGVPACFGVTVWQKAGLLRLYFIHDAGHAGLWPVRHGVWGGQGQFGDEAAGRIIDIETFYEIILNYYVKSLKKRFYHHFLIDSIALSGVYWMCMVRFIVCQGEEKKMKESYKIADAERDVMQVLWEHPEAVSTRELLDIMNEKGKNWKRQTLNTLLFRLEDKKIVLRRRGYVEPALTEVELLQKQTEELLDSFYGGKLRNFCAALTGQADLSDEEADRLEKLIVELRSKS